MRGTPSTMQTSSTAWAWIVSRGIGHTRAHDES